VLGAVFDSCPSQINVMVAAKAMYYSRALPNTFVLILAVLLVGIGHFLLHVRRWLGFASRPDMFEVS